MPEIRMVRKHKVTGEVEDSKPGRPHPDYIYGWTDDGGEFHEGRPAGSRQPAGKRSKVETGEISVEQLIAEFPDFVKFQVETISKEYKIHLEKPNYVPAIKAHRNVQRLEKELQRAKDAVRALGSAPVPEKKRKE